MAFTDLSIPLQNIVMVNFTFFIKLLLISILVGVCYSYKTYFKPKQTSPYLGVRMLRGLLYVISILILFISPLMVFLLFPQISIDIVLQFLLAFYGLLFLISGLIVGFNILQYGTAFILDLIGVDTEINKMHKSIENITGVKRR